VTSSQTNTPTIKENTFKALRLPRGILVLLSGIVFICTIFAFTGTWYKETASVSQSPASLESIKVGQSSTIQWGLQELKYTSTMISNSEISGTVETYSTNLDTIFMNVMVLLGIQSAFAAMFFLVFFGIIFFSDSHGNFYIGMSLNTSLDYL